MYGICGEDHHLFGTHCSDERKKKISIANKGRLSGEKNPSKREDVREKISQSWSTIKRNVKRGKYSSHYNSNLSEKNRDLLKFQWNICKEKESLYSFSKRNAKEYNVSMGCIQGVVYKSPKKK